MGHRFFFIFAGSAYYPVIFLLGITVFPLVCGLRCCCARLRAPKAPVEPTDPTKPTKPVEPKVGAAGEEWNQYRASLDRYRKAKAKWKEDHKYFVENQQQLRIDYERRRREYKRSTERYKKEVEEPTRQAFSNYCQMTTTHIMFCREEKPAVIQWSLKNYSV